MGKVQSFKLSTLIWFVQFISGIGNKMLMDLQTTVQVRLRLNRSLRLCGQNDTSTDCCMKPLCVLETLQVTACTGNAPQASLLIQVKIYSMLVSTNTEFGKS